MRSIVVGLKRGRVELLVARPAKARLPQVETQSRISPLFPHDLRANALLRLSRRKTGADLSGSRANLITCATIDEERSTAQGKNLAETSGDKSELKSKLNVI
jgi:hypothetical protein